MSRIEEIASDHVGWGEPLGVPLRTRLPLGRAEVASALGQIGHALVAAHAVGVGHGALSIERVFVTMENDELFVRVFGFGVALETYRHVRDDVVGLSALASELVGSSPPSGFDAWRERCASEQWTVAECVVALGTLFPVLGNRPGAQATTRGSARRFEGAASRTDREAQRVPPLDRVQPRTVVLFVLGGAVLALLLVAIAMPSSGQTEIPKPPPASLARAAASGATESDEPSRSSVDILSADRGSCPDRWLNKPLEAAKARAHRCVRAVLYQRLLDDGVGSLSAEERPALKLACAALGDLGCELQLAK